VSAVASDSSCVTTSCVVPLRSAMRSIARRTSALSAGSSALVGSS
jgi:hypothetical protein